MGRVFIMHRKTNAKRSVRARVGLRAGVLPGSFAVLLTALFCLSAPGRAVADPSPAAVAGFDAYIAHLETRLALQRNSADRFLAPFDAARVLGGEVVIEQITPASGTSFPGAMLHHWRGTAFVPGAKAIDLERLLRDYGRYPQVYAPQVITARVLSQDGNRYQTMLRVSQKHVVTVVLDTNYDVQFFPDAPDSTVRARGHNISHSTRITEIADPGAATEHALDSKQEHGFLWRLNTYWSWEERDGGLYVQIETVTLTRSVPTGLGWAIGPFVNSVPRESLDFTLRSTANALRHQLNSERTTP